MRRATLTILLLATACDEESSMQASEDPTTEEEECASDLSWYGEPGVTVCEDILANCDLACEGDLESEFDCGATWEVCARSTIAAGGLIELVPDLAIRVAHEATLSESGCGFLGTLQAFRYQ